VSPSEVFSVMLDDFRGSEEETGASRRNILSFLYKDASEQRKVILESGNNLDAEKIFRNGFTDIIPSLPWSEGVKVLSMLARLSTISGKKATVDMSGEYLRTLRKALKGDEGNDKVGGLIKVFEEFLGRRPPVDPRAVLVFLSAHGEGIVRLALEKEDRPSREFLLHGLAEYVEDSVKKWNVGGKDQEFEEGKVGPDFCEGLLRGLKVSKQDLALWISTYDIQDQRDVIGKTKDANTTVRLLEAILYAIYRIVSIVRPSPCS
jgi:hypothetical protein